MPTFAVRDEHASVARRDVLQPQAENFTAAEPTQEHGLHHRAIAMRPECCHDGIGGLRRNDARQCARCSEKWHPALATACSRAPRCQSAWNRISGYSSIAARD